MAIVEAGVLRLYVNTGSTTTPVFTDIGCELSSSIDWSTDTIETTCKDASNKKTYIPGDLGVTISFDGNVDVGDAGFDKLLNNVNSRTETLFEFKTLNSEKFTGNSIISSFSVSAAHNDCIKFSGSLTVDGALTITTA